MVSHEEQALFLINQARIKSGVKPTDRDRYLYDYTTRHTLDMVSRKQLFSSPPEVAWDELVFFLNIYDYLPDQDIAKIVVDSWLSSPYHEQWLLYDATKKSEVSIAASPDGYYVSWACWRGEGGSEPAGVRRWRYGWLAETGGKTDLYEWMQSKGYILIPRLQIATPSGLPVSLDLIPRG